MGIIDRFREKSGPQGGMAGAGPWEFDFDQAALCGIRLRDPATLLWKLGPAEDPENEPEGRLRWYTRGVEAGVGAGRVDRYVLVFQDLAGGRFAAFAGTCRWRGATAELKPGLGEAEVTAFFGNPLWREVTEGEILLFFSKGDVHWQVELHQKAGLAAVEILAAPLVLERRRGTHELTG